MIAPDILKFEITKFSKDLGDVIKRQGLDEKKLKERMYRRGYVPVLDITPFMISSYDAEKERFEYTVVIYGAKCDDDIENYEGWLNGNWIPSSMSTKSERLLSRSE